MSNNIELLDAKKKIHFLCNALNMPKTETVLLIDEKKNLKR